MPLAARWMSCTSWDEPRGTIKSIILSSRHRSSTSSRVLTWEEIRVCESHQIEECALKCYKDDTRFSLLFNKYVGNQFYHLHSLLDSMHGKSFLGELVEDMVGVGCLFSSFQQEGIATGYCQCWYLVITGVPRKWQSTFIKMETKKLAKHIKHRMCYGKFCRNTRCYYLFMLISYS